MGNEAYIDTLNVNVNITNASGREKGVMAKTSFDELNFRFSEAGIDL